jgi:hypothetical protein
VNAAQTTGLPLVFLSWAIFRSGSDPSVDVGRSKLHVRFFSGERDAKWRLDPKLCRLMTFLAAGAYAAWEAAYEFRFSDPPNAADSKRYKSLPKLDTSQRWAQDFGDGATRTTSLATNQRVHRTSSLQRLPIRLSKHITHAQPHRPQPPALEAPRRGPWICAVANRLPLKLNTSAYNCRQTTIRSDAVR